MFQLSRDFLLPFCILLCCAYFSSTTKAIGQITTSGAAQSLAAARNLGDQFAAESNQDILSRDAKLDAKISLREAGVRLSDLCSKLSETTGVRIRADRRLGEKRFQIRFSGKSARELMRALGEVTPGVWAKNEEFGSYTLMPNIDAVKYASAWWRLFNKERERQFDSMRNLLFTGMNRKDIIPPQELLKRPEVRNGLEEALFWQGLPKASQQQVIGTLSFLDTYQKFPLMTYGLDDGGVFVGRETLPARSFQALVHSATQLQGPSWASRADSIAGVDVLGAGSSLHVNIVERDGRTYSSGISLSLPSLTTTRIVFSDHRWLPEAAKKEAEKLPATWRQLSEYQQRTYWPAPATKDAADQDVAKTESNDLMLSEMYGIPERKPEILTDLAERYGFDFISDYHALPYRASVKQSSRRSSGTESQKRPTAGNLEGDLNRVAQAQDMSWKHSSSDLLLFKNNRWYRDDLLDVPSGVLDQLQSLSECKVSTEEESLIKHLDLASYAWTHLDAWRVANGLRYYTDEERWSQVGAEQDTAKANCQPFADIAATALRFPNVCRFYASLNQNQKLLFVRKRLPVAALSQEQARFLLSAFPGVRKARGVAAMIGLDAREQGWFGLPDVFSNARYGNAPYMLKIVTVAQ